MPSAGKPARRIVYRRAPRSGRTRGPPRSDDRRLAVDHENRLGRIGPTPQADEPVGCRLRTGRLAHDRQRARLCERRASRPSRQTDVRLPMRGSRIRRPDQQHRRGVEGGEVLLQRAVEEAAGTIKVVHPPVAASRGPIRSARNPACVQQGAHQRASIHPGGAGRGHHAHLRRARPTSGLTVVNPPLPSSAAVSSQTPWPNSSPPSWATSTSISSCIPRHNCRRPARWLIDTG